MAEDKEEKQIDLGSATLTAQLLESALNSLFERNKPNIIRWQAEMIADHEDNFIEVKTHVAIIDVGINQIGNWDGANGYYDLDADKYVEWMQSLNPDFDPDDSVFITKQGLLKKYRFQLIINDQGDPDIISEPYFIPIDKAIKSTVSSVEMLQRRIDM